MLQVVINVMLPVVLIAGLGFLFQRTLRPTIDGLNQLVFYVMAPCLTFASLSRVQISGDEMWQIFGYGILYFAAICALGLGISTLLRWERGISRAFIITMLQSNMNYAYSVALLSLGQPGLDRAVIFSSIPGTFGGIAATFFASNSSASVSASVKAVLKRPGIYATAIALAMNFTNTHFPPVIQSAVEMVGLANIPVVLLLMGMQLALGVAVADAPWETGIAVVMKLVGSAAIAFGLTGLVGMEGVTRQVMVIIAAVPTAIMTTVIATEFNARPRYVAGVVVITTALSVVTVSLWLVVLAWLLGTMAPF